MTNCELSLAAITGRYGPSRHKVLAFRPSGAIIFEMTTDLRREALLGSIHHLAGGQHL
jgi:hypothetical protein